MVFIQHQQSKCYQTNQTRGQPFGDTSTYKVSKWIFSASSIKIAKGEFFFMDKSSFGQKKSSRIKDQKFKRRLHKVQLTFLRDSIFFALVNPYFSSWIIVSVTGDRSQITLKVAERSQSIQSPRQNEWVCLIFACMQQQDFIIFIHLRHFSPGSSEDGTSS